MVGLAFAQAIQRFAVRREQHVHLPRVAERLHRSVDGREAHRRTSLAQEVVDLLSAAELVKSLEQLEDLDALTRLAGTDRHSALLLVRRGLRPPSYVRGPLRVRNRAVGATVGVRRDLHGRPARGPDMASKRLPKYTVPSLTPTEGAKVAEVLQARLHAL